LKAVWLTGHGGLDKLQYTENAPVPEIADDEVRIRVHACGLNNTDINTRTGWYSKGVEQGITEAAVQDGYGSADNADGSWRNHVITFPRIQGADVCGIVDSVASARHRGLIGRRVMIDPWFLDRNHPSDRTRARYFGSETDGGYAEYTIAPAGNVYPLESAYSDAEIATFACAYGTAENLIECTGLGDNETVIVSGASGGVGSATIQLAKIRNARVIALSGPGKERALLDIGADHVVSRHEPDVEKRIREIAGAGIDVAVDVVGGEIFTLLINCLRPGGRYSSSGCIAGPMVQFDLRKLVYRDLQLTGATVIPAGTFGKLVHYIEAEKLKPLLAGTWPLKDLAKAQQCFMKKTHVGNLVITMDRTGAHP